MRFVLGEIIKLQTFNFHISQTYNHFRPRYCCETPQPDLSIKTSNVSQNGLHVYNIIKKLTILDSPALVLENVRTIIPSRPPTFVMLKK